ncbi:MAG: hypothetical protein R3C05_01305 [Pirellulaceae bacterium]
MLISVTTEPLSVPEAKVVPTGSVSVMMTFAKFAATGPRFVTTTLYVNWFPTIMGSGTSVFVIDKSIRGTNPKSRVKLVFGSVSPSLIGSPFPEENDGR